VDRRRPAGGVLAGIRHRHRDLRQLYPLWELLYRATPGIALDPPRSALADAIRLRNLEFRRYRRIIEIHDGRLALRPHLDPVPDGDATAEAAALIRATDRKKRGEPANTLDPPTPDNGPVTFTEHLAWMAQVADHLRDADVTGCQETTDDPGTTPTPRTTP
jgi:hypothetical protein